MYPFLIPLVYTYITRLRTISALVSWGGIYIVLLFIFIFFDSEYVNSSNLTVFILSIILVYNNYEIGYIYNDSETIKKEKKPTLRLGELALSIYENKKCYIYIERILISLCLSFLLVHYFSVGVIFVISAWLILPVFIVYNSIRNRFNLILHFILVMLRYGCPVLIVVKPQDIIPVLIGVSLIFPIANLIERCSEKRFDLGIFRDRYFNKNIWRVIYYSIMTIAIFMYIYPDFARGGSLLACCIYMLLYRFFSPLVINRSFKS